MLCGWLPGMGCGFLLGQNVTTGSEEENSGQCPGLKRSTFKGKHFTQEHRHIYRHMCARVHMPPFPNTLGLGGP